MKTRIILSQYELKKTKKENSIKSDEDLKAYYSCFLECEPYQVEIVIEEKQRAVHKQIDMSFWFQGMTIDPKLEALKEKLADTIRDYFSEQGSSFISVVELKNK